MLVYFANFVEFPQKWFDRLWIELDWEKRPDAPRKEYWTNLNNTPYTYGRGAGERTYQARPDHPLVIEAREHLNTVHGFWLEGCFLNGYETSRDWLGWHADDDPGIDHTKPIAIITVGQERVLQTREILVVPDKGTKGEFGPVESQMLENGSLCLMPAGMQATHQHRIPKVSHNVNPRISLTFRGLR